MKTYFNSLVQFSFSCQEQRTSEIGKLKRKRQLGRVKYNFNSLADLLRNQISVQSETNLTQPTSAGSNPT